MKKILTIAATALVAACVATRPPVTPTPHVSRVRIQVVDTAGQPVTGGTATIDNAAIHAQPTQTQTVFNCPDHCGVVAWDVPALNGNILVQIPGYSFGGVPMPQCVVTTDQEPGCTVILTKLAPPRPMGKEVGPLHQDGPRILRADGSLYYPNGFSDFALFQRFLHGEDIQTILDDRLAIGYDTFRVFGQFVGTPGDPNDQGIGASSGLGHLNPADYPDYYDRLTAFAQALSDRGVRIEFVAVADNQVLHTNAIDHLNRVYAALKDIPTSPLVEFCNEPFKNGCDPNDRAIFANRPASILVATGNYDIPWDAPAPFQVGQYLTWHSDRSDEWPRSPRGAGDISDWLNANAGGRVAVWADEPMGFGETDGRRSTSVSDARYFAVACRQFANGCTFHSDDGIASTLLEPKQKAAAIAFYEALNWAPADAPFAPYQRGCAGGGACVGDMPMDHHDLDEGVASAALRTFCKATAGLEWCDAIRATAGWSPKGLRGCTLKEQPFPDAPGIVSWSCPEGVR